MRYRLDILDENGITIDDITAALEAMEPLEGAGGFLESLERRWPTIVLSDTFSIAAGGKAQMCRFCYRQSGGTE